MIIINGVCSCWKSSLLGALMFSYGILAMLLRKLFTNADAAIGVGGIISETIKALISSYNCNSCTTNKW